MCKWIKWVFGNNFVNTVIVQSSTPSGVKISHASSKILKGKDTIHVYKKKSLLFKPQYIKKDQWDTHYSFFIDEKNNW